MRKSEVTKIVKNTVKYISELPEDVNLTMARAMKNACPDLVDKIDFNEMFELNDSITNELEKLDVILDKSSHDGKVEGLPWNLDFYVKHVKRFRPSFKVGDVVSHDELRDAFKVGNMGGMRRSKECNSLVLISDHTKGLYDDKWIDGELHYTGQGKIGDQEIGGRTGPQNKTLAESNSNGVAVHLFEVLVPTEYIYRGIVILYDDPYQEIQPDDNGNDRKVWMFPLKPIYGVPVVDGDDFEKSRKTKEKKAQSLNDSDLKKAAQRKSKEGTETRTVTSNQIVRDPVISEYVKRRAKGVCDLCKMKAPFNDKKGNPYLESHHVEWLSEGGEDSIDNAVALCPNCHRRMHVVADASDVQELEKVLADYKTKGL